MILGLLGLTGACAAKEHPGAATMAMIPGLGLAGISNRKQVMSAPDASASGTGAIDSLIAELNSSIEEVRVRANAAIKDLPPLEQVEAANEVGWAIRMLASAGKDLATMCESIKIKVKDTLSKYTDSTAQAAAANAEQAILAGGEYIKKSDHEAALNLAVSNKETELRNAFQAERQRDELIKTRRSELLGLKELPESAVSAISAEALAGEDYKDQYGKLKDRYNKLTVLGLDPVKGAGFVAEIMGYPLSEEGDGKVQARIQEITSLASALPASASAAGANASLQLPTGGNPGAKGAPLRCF